MMWPANWDLSKRKNRDCAEEIMNEECLICKAPLTYLEADMLMECEICHKKKTARHAA